jgi:RNA polymerase sigma factor (sigma-70 family)
MTLWLAQPRLAGVSNKGLIWRQMTPFVQQCDENIATVSPCTTAKFSHPSPATRSGGLTEAYDRYADPLYKYCVALLGEPAEAADAVQDTFVIAAARAAARLVDLREPYRFRAWLYAVARNECQRITRPGRPVFASAQAPDVTAGAADVPEDAERARLRGLLDAATRGLTPDEREVIELELRQGLAVAEVAAVVGVSRTQANALASRARKHLEACLGAVVVARAR